jgi:hypothetical protein
MNLTRSLAGLESARAFAFVGESAGNGKRLWLQSIRLGGAKI